MSAFGFIRGMKLLPNWVVYEETGSMPVSEFVGEDRHHPTPSSEEEGLSVFIVSKSVPAPHQTDPQPVRYPQPGKSVRLRPC